MAPPIHQSTLGELYDEYARPLYAYACVLARSATEAEEIVQETFVRIARRPERLAEVENVRAYLFSMLRNEAFRHRSRWHRWWYGDLAAGRVRFVEAAADRTSDADAVARAMDRLPPTQREVVYLKVWQEMTFAEIGRLLGQSPNTAASAYRYGLAKLKRWLDHDR